MNKYFLVHPVGRQSEFMAIRSDSIRLFFYRVAALPLYERWIITEWISDIGIDGCTVAMHFPIGGDRDFSPRWYVIVGFIEILRTIFGLFHPVKFPITVQQYITAGTGAFPRATVSRICLHFFHIGKRNECGMSVFFVYGKNVLVFPIIVAVGFQWISFYFHIRFDQNPLLIGLADVRFQLENRFSYQACIWKPQIISTCHAGKNIIPIGLPINFPSLVWVVQIIAPLQDTSFYSSISTIVNGLLRQRTDYAINIFFYGYELPYLRFFTRNTSGNEYFGTGVHAFLIIHFKTAQRVYLICLPWVYALCCGTKIAEGKYTG